MAELNQSTKNKISSVCILTAGLGTKMGKEYASINKALLPLGNKAIISHIIDDFPIETNFIIAVGHKKKQVYDYLNIAHPKNNFIFVEIDKFIGKGSGPGYSLLSCKKYLQKPFYFIASDTIFKSDYKNLPNENWAGVSKVNKLYTQNYCNFKIKNNIVTNIKDKVKAGDKYTTFTGFLFIKDFKIFWNGLSKKQNINGEHQISNGLKSLLKYSKLYSIKGKWQDLGNKKNYRNALKYYHDFDFSKTDEFIYFLNKKVIKFFNKKEIVKNRILKTKINKKVFPKIIDNTEQFYAYNYIEGKTLYEVNNVKLFKDFIKWLDKSLWLFSNKNKNKINLLCDNFYRLKTKQRFNLFKNKYKFYRFKNKVNNQKIYSLNFLLNKINWDILCSGSPFFIHGDLQLDNVIYNKDVNKFYLLDWRHDFAGESKFGDIYYDLSKMMGGLRLNYDYIKSNKFSYQENNNDIYIDFAVRNNSVYYEKILLEYVKNKKLDFKKIDMLVSIIYINMSPLHHYPFDKFLYYLGTLLLTNMYDNKKYTKYFI